MQEKEFFIKLHYCVLHGYVEIWLWQGIFNRIRHFLQVLLSVVS